MKNKNIKFPNTDTWSHSDLANANNCTNQQIWSDYQEMIKNGTIVSAGERKGKGKPTRLWRVADTTKVIQSTPKIDIQSQPRAQRQVSPVEVKEVTTDSVAPVIEEKSRTTLSTVPTDALVVSATTSEPDVELEAVTVEDEDLPKAREVEPNYRTLENMPCPICGKSVIAWNDATGVMVQCNQTIEVCPCNENPYGHGKTEKVAYEILCQKYGNRKA